MSSSKHLIDQLSLLSCPEISTVPPSLLCLDISEYVDHHPQLSHNQKGSMEGSELSLLSAVVTALFFILQVPERASLSLIGSVLINMLVQMHMIVRWMT